jgi:hypothetical protein
LELTEQTPRDEWDHLEDIIALSKESDSLPRHSIVLPSSCLFYNLISSVIAISLTFRTGNVMSTPFSVCVQASFSV